MDYVRTDDADDACDAAEAGADDGAASRLSVGAWLTRNIRPPDFLLGELLSTTSRLMLIGPTGLGKTMFAMEIAFALALGRGFLHWSPGRPCRVLYIDGEMPKRLIKARLAEVVKRWGETPATLFILARDDVENMPPLNRPDGQEFVAKHIKELKHVDFIIFDNVQGLLSGNQREGDAWESTKPWLRKLTRQHIGQLWIHHTGHNEDHGYGDKTREWEMSTVMLMKRAGPPEADVAFKLDFTKTRERTPQNRADFAPMMVTLTDDQWRSAPVKGGGGQENQKSKLLTLIDREKIVPHPPDVGIPNDAKCRMHEHIRKAWIAAETEAKPGNKPDSHDKSFRRNFGELKEAGVVGQHEVWVWINPEHQ